MATMDNTKYVESVLTKEINWNSHFVSHSKRHWEAMLRFSYSLCNDRSKAEDIHQTSLLKSLKAFQKFVLNYNSQLSSNEDIDSLFLNNDVQYHFKNWLYRIVKNTYIDDKDINKKWKLDTSDITLDSLQTEQSDPLQTNYLHNFNNIKNEEKEFYRLALDDKWKKRFSLLNDRQRSIIFLAAEDYSYKDISAILGIPMGTVMSTLSRTLQKLKSNSPDLE
jgi:RNA polymerase sigma factor (sigma-70 family)